MKFHEIFPYLCLIVLLIAQLNTGLDLTHHVHNAWLYNQMIIDTEFLTYDPYLLRGEQLTFSYGLIAYPIAGVAWFVFSFFTIDILMILVTLIDFIILNKLLEKHPYLWGIILLSLLFHVLGDTYVAHVSNMLFWVGVYMFYTNKKLWQIPIILACINHPSTLIAAAYFVFKDKKLFAILGAIIVYFIAITYFFTQTSSITFYLPGVFIFRFLILISPIILIEDVFIEIKKNLRRLNIIKEKDLDSNISLLRRIVFYKVPLIYVILIICATIILTQNIIYLIFLDDNNLFLFNSLDTLTKVLFDEFPNVSGTIRSIDYLWLPSLVYFNDNITLTEGSFRENNIIRIENTPFYWEDENYKEFVSNDNFDYVLICKKCSPPTNEKELLDAYYSLVWENEYYYLYSVQ